jgi:pimeloyl-ACP methyl ester carboxylesterase
VQNRKCGDAAPSDGRDLEVYVSGPDSARDLLKEYAAPESYSTAEAFVALWPTLIPGRDRRALRSELGECLAQQMGDGVRNSVDGWLDDIFAIFRPWRFLPAKITPPVLPWQGGNDLIVPRDHWLWLSRHVPTAQSTLLLDDGYFSVTVDHADEMISQLAALL